MADHPRQILAAALAAVEPQAAVLRALHLDGERLVFPGGSVPLGRRTILIGAGKASAPMAAAVEEILGDRIAGGLIVVKYDHGCALRRTRIHEAAHPVPDAAGLAGAAALLAAVHGLSLDDLVICALSGGASALLPAPVEGVGLDGKQAVTRLLLASGADIGVVNTVRKHLSRIKGGRLALHAAPATVLTLAISDVIGDDWGTIGSGPTVPDAGTLAQARAACVSAGIWDSMPASARAALLDPANETPKPDHTCFRNAHRVLVADNGQALTAAGDAATALGYTPERLRATLSGEASRSARDFVAQAIACARRGGATALLGGGETTVTLGPAPGRGGRNQEFALAAALELERQEPALASRITILAAGTDGSDGPTDAAGGLVDASTCARARAAGRDPGRDLAGHDAYPCLDAAGALLRTGPTRTNVMDVAIALIAA